MKKLLILLMALALFSPLSAVQAADGAKVYKAKRCSSCHSVSGKKKMAPNLGGMAAADFTTKMAGYKNKTIKGGKSRMMYGPAKKVNDADIAAMAAYLAAAQ